MLDYIKTIQNKSNKYLQTILSERERGYMKIVVK